MAEQRQSSDAAITRRATLQAGAALASLPLAAKVGAREVPPSNTPRPSGHAVMLNTTVNGRHVKAEDRYAHVVCSTCCASGWR